MGIFEDLSRFLEIRLDEFLKSHPHLELQAIEEQLREQEEDTLRLIASFRIREKQLEQQILETAKDIQRWHGRIEKAKAAKRFDLVEPAEAREAELLRQGNQFWGQMKGVKDRIQQSTALHQQLQTRRKEVQAEISQAQAARAASQTQTTSTTPGWGAAPNVQSSAYRTSADPLEATFQQWETEDELEQMKREMGR
ncbi:MAG: TIGR04376 family protein [Elainellaceae cyanobacterium]